MPSNPYHMRGIGVRSPALSGTCKAEHSALNDGLGGGVSPAPPEARLAELSQPFDLGHVFILESLKRNRWKELFRRLRRKRNSWKRPFRYQRRKRNSWKELCRRQQNCWKANPPPAAEAEWHERPVLPTVGSGTYILPKQG